MKKLLLMTLLVLVLDNNALAETHSESLLIVVLDSSPSVRRYWSDMRSSAQELIRNAPEQVAIGVVGIDAEAQKSDVFPRERRREAIEFVQQLNIGGRLTDLARGTDATLALLQQANPSSCVIVYITDGELAVPKNFRNQGTFFDLLRHEFTPRPNVEVFVINVKGNQSAQREALPGNVRIISLKSFGELRETIAQHLTLTIKEKLDPVVVTPQALSSQISKPSGRWLKFGVPGLILLLGTLLGAIAWRRRRNRTAADTSEIHVTGQPPADAMCDEDLLTSQQLAEIVAPPVVLITAADSVNRQVSMRRRIVRTGEQVIVGGYRFAELALPGLNQARTLQLRFDGKAIKTFRLRPQPSERPDDVQVNQVIAPPDFTLGDKDVLKVGDFILSFVIGRENELPESWQRTEMAPTSRSQAHSITTGRRLAPRNVGARNYDNGTERQ